MKEKTQGLTGGQIAAKQGRRIDELNDRLNDGLLGQTRDALQRLEAMRSRLTGTVTDDVEQTAVAGLQGSGLQAYEYALNQLEAGLVEIINVIADLEAEI